MEEGKISIIVPVYNAEETLERCINSLLHQTYYNIEIILINDGSSDNSGDICSKFESLDDRIKFIVQENGGVSTARNAGLDAATGQFLMFCDSDDWAEPEWCEILLSSYTKDNLIMCGAYIEGNQSCYPHEVMAEIERQSYPKTDYIALKHKLSYVLWNKIFLHEVVRNHNIRFDPVLSNGEDMLFIIKYLNNISGKIVFLRRCGMHYLWSNSDSLSRRVPENYFVQLEHLNTQLFSEFKKLGLVDKKIWSDIHTDLFNEYAKGMIPIFESKDDRFRNRRTEIRQVMKSTAFDQCLKDARISTNRIYCLLWKTKCIQGLRYWHRLRSMKGE